MMKLFISSKNIKTTILEKMKLEQDCIIKLFGKLTIKKNLIVIAIPKNFL